MPTGRVRWFDAAKGYGFITNDETGEEVFVHFSGIVADGYKTLEDGQKVTFDTAEGNVEYSVVDGRRGPQAMDVRLIASAPSLVKATRPKADDMAAICEDLIKMLDAAGNTLRRHRYPSAADSKKLATLLRAVADQFDVQD